MIVSISQPAYLPWLGYFDRIFKSDVHIVLDDVMLERSSKTRFTNRNKIKTHQGSLWLTIPVVTSGLGQPFINTVIVENESKWQHKHFQTLNGSYKKSDYFVEHKSWFEDFYNQEWKLLSPILEYSTNYLLNILGITSSLIRSSELKVEGEKSDYILNLCKEIGATVYLSGPFGQDYLDLTKFEKEKIEVWFHDYQHPEYSQLFKNFVPYMSIVDLLFNEGSKSLKILTKGSKSK